MKLIKFRYEWYEGDRDAMFICHPTKTTEEFYEDLKRIMIEAGKDNNEKYENVHYCKCLPTDYGFIIKTLEEEGYIITDEYYDTLFLEDDFANTLSIRKRTKEYNWERIE